MRRLFHLTVLTVAFAVIFMFGCAPAVRQTSQQVDAANTGEQQAIYQNRQPVPRFEWSQQRDTLIQIYVLQNEARSTFTTFHSNGTGAVIFACPSRGYAIPADAQLTNPVQLSAANIVPSRGNTYVTVEGVIELPEPNGIYSGKNTDGTWVVCVRESGEAVPVYSELKVQTFPFEVSWDEARQLLIDQRKQSSSSLQIRTQTPAPSPSPAPAVLR